NNVRFIERPHLYALGSSEDVVRRFVPDAVQCTSSPDEALAFLAGHKAPRHRLRSVVGHIADEFIDVVTSVSQVFHLDEVERPRRPSHTPSRGVRAMTRTPARGAAVRSARPPAPPPLPRLPRKGTPIGRDTLPLTSIGRELPVCSLVREVDHEDAATTPQLRAFEDEPSTRIDMSPFMERE
ncbi:MAG TPA: hypothetical protein VGO00_20640, partial [Kofleriaceae bacterium]|nr:hypothetical protein [Kofleriaceae bacterium]